MGDDLSPLEAARMSTGNETGSDQAKDDNLRDYLWRHKHATPFEMNALQLEVQCPIFVAREWMRHRVPFSYNEYSQRYSEALDLYYVPSEPRVRNGSQSLINKQGSEGQIEESVTWNIINSMVDEQETQREIYMNYINQGLSRELARNNIPVSNYTRFRVQSNLRGWLQFVDLRIRQNAQYEIRVYAKAIAKIIEEIYPKTWQVFEEHTLYGHSFSRKEIQVLQKILKDLGIKKEEVEDFLGKSRSREFFQKLGL
jgi:thymidylate synthase (FAD)